MFDDPFDTILDKFDMNNPVHKKQVLKLLITQLEHCIKLEKLNNIDSSKTEIDLANAKNELNKL